MISRNFGAHHSNPSHSKYQMQGDLLQILPYEAWVRCMQLYARDQAGGVLPLLGVSLSWQANLLATPEVWTAIHLDGGPDERSRVECFFHLSGTMFVELIIESNHCALDLAIKYKERIETLCFYNRLDLPYHTINVSYLSQRLTTTSFPNLANIYVKPPRQNLVYIPPNLIAACPVLNCIRGAYIKQDHIAYLPESIRMLSVSGDGVIPVGLCDRLEVMRIECEQLHPNNSNVIRYPNYFTGENTLMTEFELVFGVYHHTTSMDRPLLSGGLSDHLIPIQAFTCTPHHNLRILRLTMPWYDIAQVIPHLSACTALRELSLSLNFRDYFSGAWRVYPLTIGDIGHVRKLFLGSAPFDWMQLHLRSHLPLIIELFAGGALGLLEELYIAYDGEVKDSRILDLLRTAPNLKALRLDGFLLEQSTHGRKKITLNLLDTLEVYHRDDIEWFDAPNLSELKCERGRKGHYCPPRSLSDNLESVKVPPLFFIEWNNSLAINSLETGKFPRLQSAQFSAENWIHKPLGHLDLANLQVVTFVRHTNYAEVPKFYGAEPNPVINHFMLELLLFPQNCPRLHTIRSIRYPSWALATAMFLRRNSLKAVTPILSFWLPRFPQFSILSCLVRAIGCSGEDPDALIATAVQIDETLHRRWGTKFFWKRACKRCIVSGYISCASEDRYKGPQTDEPLILELLHMVKTAVKSSRPITASQWRGHFQDKFMQDDDVRERICSLHDEFELVHIGPGALDNISYLDI
ncbi:hypothetical protein M408DRAFT_25224 [Serendipita vermifera MAFF 305830]|uniref:Uncharacterized protein n=1 Tax=Serendipita vermifera MAFF 305830 TaxID=933852 RepID=A0A0C3B2U0_SERVB|nr:hypothetical protein M408DRAFT_25224 [Serendipita vermifera MAFF 305830]